MGARRAVVRAMMVTTLVACGSSRHELETSGARAGAGGEAGHDGGTGGGAAGSAPDSRAGHAGSAMTAAAGSSGAAAGRSGSAGMAARSSGGSAGISAGGTAGGDPTDWRAACAGVTINGTCQGNIYEWCDYFTGALKSIDCTSLGMTCRANPTEPGEVDRNGCVGSSCTSSGITCDGELRTTCVDGQLVTMNCTKQHGPGATCTMTSGSTSCSDGEACSPPKTIACDGNVIRLCTEDGQRRYVDCARSDPTGTCAELSPGASYGCGGIIVGP